MIALSLVTSLPLFLTLPQQTDDAPEPPTRSEIAGAIDGSIRWVRAQQDPKTGAYRDVGATALALLALSESPRGYVVSDGPFVADAADYLVRNQRADGAIATPEATPGEATASTRHAAQALRDVGGHARAVQRASEFLDAEIRVGGFATEALRAWHARTRGDQEPALTARAEAGVLLAARAENGSWSLDDDALRATCDGIRRLSVITAFLRSLESAPAAHASEALPTFSPGTRDRAVEAFERGTRFLLEQAVEPGKWGFQGHADPGITAMVTGALLSLELPRDERLQGTIDAALDYLVSLQREDGSIHAGQLANYVTSASIMALSRGGRPADEPVIARAAAFLRVLQADEGEGYAPDDRFYGGVGYGGDERPDLSNLQMALEALSEAGAKDADETFQKAIVFLQRCQNRSESNDIALVSDGSTIVGGEDGGAGYAPGDSKAGFIELRDGKKVPRSYGSMTYALLKSYLFAGLERDDPRVEAAWEWLTENYTLDVNPGFEASSDPAAAYQGLYYYFTTMAKALDLYGVETIRDAAGNEHAWRAEILGRLVSLQRPDGSWVNANAARWYEGNPVLATAYALISLGTALPD